MSRRGSSGYDDAEGETERIQISTTTTRAMDVKKANPRRYTQERYPLAGARTPYFLRSFNFVHGGEEVSFRSGEGVVPDDGDQPMAEEVPQHFYSNQDRKRSCSDPDRGGSPRKRVDVAENHAYDDSDDEVGDDKQQADNDSSPHLSLLSPSISPITQNYGVGMEQRLMNIPNMIESFEELPAEVKRYVLFSMLRRCDRSTLSAMSGLIIPALRCDFVGLLPLELAHSILSYLDAQSLCRAAQVSRSWKAVVDSADWVWKDLLDDDEFALEPGELDRFATTATATAGRTATSDAAPYAAASRGAGGGGKFGGGAKKQSWGVTPVHTPVDEQAQPVLPLPSSSNSNAMMYKMIYRHKYLVNKNWMNPNSQPKHISFPGHGRDVVTCLQFDDDKIITGSDDHTINVYDTSTGRLRTTLRGHDGGVWALQYVNGNTLVSGSTDRTVRIWDIEQERCTHIFYGHTSTVRCLDILHPVEVVDKHTGKTTVMPKEPLIVTGSRDSTLRVWRLPNEDDDDYLPANIDQATQDPYFLRALTGHTHNVRVISGHGDTVVSGSYDTTVRVWKVSTGECQWELTGHTQRVYSAVIDPKRNRCISGSMDWYVKVWCLETGSLLYTLEGHTSLVGLLDLNRSNLVSAAADATLRVWNPDTGEFLHKLKGHQGAITCFQHDEHKVVSGSEKTLKLWNVRTGQLVRDLLDDLNGIWQVKFDNRRCVAAVKRQNDTFIEVLDFEGANDH
ncbi:hypothetical protein TRICI_006209 [Trichomonascus ciferrii]|uniref:F-box domain-containing protein n=1 Tax=Trichomonascus ciferrii TaxID=44093 RepID=A0A642UJI8_9ASCO|nr:hypothetical protein TRICI_006209 [Trichomonascus ciferrii]